MSLTEDYLKKDLRLTEEELELRQQFLALKLPKIIDFHVHYGAKGNVGKVDSDIFSNLISTYPYFEVNHHKQVNELFYGTEQSVWHVAFPFPMRGWDHKSNNHYLQELVAEDYSIIPFMMGVVDDIEYTISEIMSGKWQGVKMYPKQLDSKATKVTDFFLEEILEAINKAGLCLILHLPNDIIRDWTELETLFKKYKNAKFILAHFGLSRDCKTEKNELKRIFHKLKDYDNVFLDTAWFFEEDILSLGLDIFGHKKILYATDQPINLVRCEFFRHPETGKDRVLSSTIYHWVDSKEREEYLQFFSGDINNVLSVHFKIVSSILNVINKYQNDRNVVEDVFYKNALRVLHH
jgi:predicted TIM-barrel fold metal-dependent hydrolase